MLAFEEALARVLHGVKRLGCETVGLRAAAGRVLAEDVHAAEELPRFDYSAMDGYALAASSVRGAPARLPLVGESRAGAPLERLAPGSACRIFTGAALPAGADSVIAVE